MREPNAEQFLKDVTNHRMTVMHERGVYRHIRFRQPDNGNMWFELVTWPNVLSIHGDMGTWTFSRVEDMLTFFRGKELKINPSYWAEKLRHGTHGGSDGTMVWDDDSFKTELLSIVDGYGLDDMDFPVLVQAIKDDVLSYDGKYDLVIAARDFSCKLPSGGKFQFDSVPDGEVYAYHFLWCLFAIVWGIEQWDARQAVAA